MSEYRSWLGDETDIPVALLDRYEAALKKREVVLPYEQALVSYGRKTNCKALGARKDKAFEHVQIPLLKFKSYILYFFAL